jgi:hypothetical protein
MTRLRIKGVRYLFPPVPRTTLGLPPTVSSQFRQRCFIHVGSGILAETGGGSKQEKDVQEASL